MSKLSSVTFERLIAQAEEARELQLDHLADSVLNAIGPTPRDEQEGFVFSYAELEETVHKALWKVALEVVAYHDLKTVDIQKIGTSIDGLAKNVLSEVEGSIGVKYKVGPHEKALPGEKK